MTGQKSGLNLTLKQFFDNLKEIEGAPASTLAPVQLLSLAFKREALAVIEQGKDLKAGGAMLNCGGLGGKCE